MWTHVLRGRLDKMTVFRNPGSWHKPGWRERWMKTSGMTTIGFPKSCLNPHKWVGHAFMHIISNTYVPGASRNCFKKICLFNLYLRSRSALMCYWQHRINFTSLSDLKQFYALEISVFLYLSNASPHPQNGSWCGWKRTGPGSQSPGFVMWQPLVECSYYAAR